MKQNDKKIEERIGQLLDSIPLLEGDERFAAVEELKTLYEMQNASGSAKTSKLAAIVTSVSNVAGVILPTVVSVVFMNRGFKFEQTGTYCSQTFKWLQKFFKIGR